MIHLKGTLQYDPARGVIYFNDEQSGQCLLRVEGVRGVPPDTQIDIHLVDPGNAHHHENCGNRKKLMGPNVDPGMFCAEKLDGKAMTLQDLQDAVARGWTGELYSDEFKGRQSSYKDFDHALKHIQKIVGRLIEMTEEADHGGAPNSFTRPGVGKYVGDLVICAARLMNTVPGDPMDLGAAVEIRVNEKILRVKK